MASILHCYRYLQEACCCCRSEGDLEESACSKPKPPPDIDTEREKADDSTRVTQDLFPSVYELPAPMMAPRSITTPQPRSILVSTPESAARRASRQVSSVLRFAPDADDSVASDDTPSEFSRLAGRHCVSQETILKSNGTPRRTLGEMSIAKLTSGISDGNGSSR